MRTVSNLKSILRIFKTLYLIFREIHCLASWSFQASTFEIFIKHNERRLIEYDVSKISLLDRPYLFKCFIEREELV